MRWSTFGRFFLRALFILYCIEAGVLLTLSPWREVWPRLILDLPSDAIRSFLLQLWGRSAVSGFGLVHLVWGLHDLHQLLGRGRRQAAEEGNDGRSPRVEHDLRG